MRALLAWKGWRRVWPRTLFGQLLLIMLSGTLAIQLLSSSIWFDVRFAQVLEAPIRLVASRTGELIRTTSCEVPGPVQAPARYQVRCVDVAPRVDEPEVRGLRRSQLLLQQALAYELGHEQPVRLLKVGLRDPDGQPLVWRSLFGLQVAQAQVRFAVARANGRWLEIEGQELQGWSGESAGVLIADYLLRVYALRLLAVLVVCWLAVRLCLRPLRRLGDAARGLGDNLEQPPLVVEGPVEVREAAQAFNAMQERLIAMVNDQSYFLAAVSHDLRTPLTRMRLRIERLADLQQRERLRQNIAQMDGMIGQVLDYLQSAEHHDLLAVDIDPLLAQVCAELATAQEPLPIQGTAGVVRVNAVLLQRCLQNLLVNALRYACDIRVQVQSRPEGVSILVEDRGPGIAAPLLGSITEPFVRGEASRNLRSGGYGLGLSIARRIALSHEGHLSLVNREGGGLRVTVWLPRT
ncbi:ATP-binding protein [Pseudomonas aegrilactucae]|uniref:histidine kinase n=1 Tax=Pseudomonas aegrilactucae TaxID=2854028 RepID=A0A9Q2XGP2_9PSED|nr:ATP-binding protein [Pseudomonas aegrilactucae]MBV6286726.1 HAMP domain-containing protein [Pseudomonas aegrilactucae]